MNEKLENYCTRNKDVYIYIKGDAALINVAGRRYLLRWAACRGVSTIEGAAGDGGASHGHVTPETRNPTDTQPPTHILTLIVLTF